MITTCGECGTRYNDGSRYQWDDATRPCPTCDPDYAEREERSRARAEMAAEDEQDDRNTSAYRREQEIDRLIGRQPVAPQPKPAPRELDLQPLTAQQIRALGVLDAILTEGPR